MKIILTGIPKTALLALCVLSCIHSACAGSQGKPVSNASDAQSDAAIQNRLYVGPIFLTGDTEIPEAKAVVVDNDGRIVALMKQPPDETRLQVITLPGKLAVPGLHDAHMHLEGLGRKQDLVDLTGAQSTEAVVERIRDWMKDRPQNEFVLGRGWDQNLFPEKNMPQAEDLSVLPAVPIILTRVDGHAVWVNKRAMALSGISADTTALEGGTIAVNSDGEPTGVFVDAAMDLVRKNIPPPSKETVKRWLRQGLEACAQSGLVAVHDMGMSTSTYEVLLELAAAERIPLRVFVYLNGSDPRTIDLLQESPSAPLVSLVGVKLMADGAMGSRGAALDEDYTDAPGHRGLLQMNEKILEEKVRTVHERGFQVAIHAIGDRANRAAIGAIASVQGDDLSRRHRIEHVQLLHPADFDAFKKLHLIASMQPTHATSDMGWVEERIGPVRSQQAYAWRTLLDRGAHLAFGSDAPVESIRPLWGLYAAVTRQDHQGEPKGGWHPEQKLLIHEALDGFSSGAAYAVKQEKRLGSLLTGFQFDVTLLDRDPRADASLWLDTQIRGTVVNGEAYLGAKDLESTQSIKRSDSRPSF
jgi:predicted amidohydrolase YtcJ